MATYLEIRDLFAHADLHNKIEVACLVAANTISAEDAGTISHAERVAWAKEALSSPSSTADKMLMAVLAVNNAVSTSGILSADDATLQTAVDNSVNLFAV